MKPRIFITRTVPGNAFDILEQECEIEIWTDDVPVPRDILIEKVRKMDGLLCMLTDRIDAEVLDAAGSDLKVVSNYAVGFDNIDITAATSRGIPVGNTPGVLTDTTADLAFALLMSAARRIGEGADFTRAGKWRSWSPNLLNGVDVFGATLGILGMGRIGRAVAKRAVGFDMKVVFHNRSPLEIEGTRSVDFNELLEESDFLSLHIPLYDSTFNIIGKDELCKMKSTAVLINTARGSVVDHDALYEALKEGQIVYAALDVTEPEPLPAEHRLYTLENCLIVPHLGSATVATRSRMGELAVQNLLAGLRGEPLPNCVNSEIYG